VVDACVVIPGSDRTVATGASGGPTGRSTIRTAITVGAASATPPSTDVSAGSVQPRWRSVTL
jgi:hypothetical protein